MATGRPSTFTQPLADRICEAIASGDSMRTVCAAEGMPAMSSIFKWLSEKPAFSEQYARAMDERTEVMIEDMLQISDDSTKDYVTRLNYNGPKPEKVVDAEHINRSRLRVETRKWIASKLKPKKYGDLTQLQHSGSIEFYTQIEERLAAGRKRAAGLTK